MREAPRQRWQAVESLFHRVRVLDEPARRRLLEEETGHDPELRREVRSLLDAHVEAEGFLETTGSAPPAADPMIGRRLGPWRVESRLGAGGMGAVYRARRATGGFEQDVAIKMIRPGLGAGDLADRFRRERQVLAGLAHPGIARLIDGGATGDGMPWLVMELVDGRPIDVFCDERRLPPEQRIDLFLEVCDAVAHAHRNLVVHRDLKPANILVTADGRVKLLDFGVARILADGPGPDEATATAQRRLTPAYASPEQLTGAPISTAADVYSLGVVLYELLTGHHPHELRRASAAEAERVVGAEPPLRPTTAVGRPVPTGDSGDDGETTLAPREIAARRGTDPRRLRKIVAGDLESILLMALRPEPRRRYGSVDQLAADLRRWRAGEPVLARPDTPGYRLARFIGRHRGPVAATAIIALLLAGGVVTSSTMYVSAERARQRERHQRQLAEQTGRFLEALLASVSPERARGRDVRVLREVLDEAARRLDGQLGALPEATASLHLIIGRTYDAIGAYDAAAAQAEAAVRGFRELGPEAARSLADALALRGTVHTNSGRHEEAEADLRETLEIRRTELPENHPAIGRALARLGVSLANQGRYDEAEPPLSRAVEILRGPEADPRDLARALIDRAYLHGDRRLHEPAIADAEAAFEVLLDAGGDGDPALPDACASLGWALRRAGRPEEAERWFRRGLDLAETLYGAEHPQSATVLDQLAGALEEQGRREEAEPLYRRSLSIYHAVHGEDHPNVATAHNNLGNLLRRMDRLADAERHLEQAVAIYRRTLGPDHVFVAIALQNLVDVLEQRDALARAEPLVADCRRIQAAVWPEPNPRTIAMQSLHGAALVAEGRGDEGRRMLRAAVEAARAHLGADHEVTRAAIRRLERVETRGADGDAASPR